MDERVLWWELDKIAVRESTRGRNMEKADAAENMMKWLKKPSHEQCQQMYIKDQSGE